MNKFLAPVLSAQFMTDATGRQFEILTFVPDLVPLPISEKYGSFVYSIMATGAYLFCSFLC